jgi:hypothetical protein
VTDAQSREVGLILRRDAITHDSRRLVTSSPLRPFISYNTNTRMFVLQSVSGLGTKRYVMHCYVAIVTSEESLFC